MLARKPPRQRKTQFLVVKSEKRPGIRERTGRKRRAPSMTPIDRTKTPKIGSAWPRKPAFSKRGANPQQKAASRAQTNADEEFITVRICGGEAKASEELPGPP